MTPTNKLLASTAIMAAVPISVFLLSRSQEQKALAVDLTSIGLVSTGVGVIVGLWAVPTFVARPWIAAGILTALSLLIKVQMLPHGGDAATPELAAVY